MKYVLKSYYSQTMKMLAPLVKLKLKLSNIQQEHEEETTGKDLQTIQTLLQQNHIFFSKLLISI